MRAAWIFLLAVPVPPEDAAFRDTVRPFLAAHCAKCHGETQAKAGLRVDRLRSGLADGEDVAAWEKVLDQLKTGEMPPRKEPRPKPAELEAVRAWIAGGLGRAADKARQAPGRAVLRRLNRAEYDNTIRDLFGIDCRPASRFPQDDSAHGFDNVGSALTVSPILLQKYLQAAELVTSRAIVGERPKAFQKRWFGKELAYGKYLKELEAAGRAIPEDGVVFFQSGPQANGGENLTAYQIPYTHPKFKTAVPGEYVLRLKASHVGFGCSERLKGKIYYEPKHLADYPEGTIAPVVKVLKDGELVGRISVSRTPEVYEIRAYAEAGQAFEYTFENGPPNVNHGRLEVLRDYPGPGLAVHWIELEGPVYDAWPPKSHRTLFVREAAKDRAAAREVLERFAARAYRRPVRPGEVDDLLALFDSRHKDGKTFEQSVAAAVELALCSPSFLYLAEPKGGTLDAWELASRLSYFLWSSMPDDALFRRAAEGTLLSDPRVLEAEVRRMLADPKAAALTRNFASQWLHLSKLDAVSVDGKLYPAYTDYLRTLFRRETDAFFEEILKHDLSVLNFIDSDFAMLNDRLAQHYGIEGVEGPEFRRVALPKDSRRGGLLGQSCILTFTTCGTQTSPVMRGTWVLETLLGSPPPPPPKDVPALTPDTKGATTIRERLAKHRSEPSCAGCHDRIDPLGLALENYNVVGLWRLAYPNPRGSKPGLAVDASATLATGETVDGPEGLKRILMARKDRFCRGLAEKMTTYALGRGLNVGDRAAVDALAASLEKDGYRMSALILGIVKSEPFRSK